MLPGQMLSWQLASVRDGPLKLSLKFGQNWVSNSWDTPDMDTCRQNNCCQMLLWQLESVQDVPRNLCLRFYQNWIINSWDISDIELVWWMEIIFISGMSSCFHQKPFYGNWGIFCLESPSWVFVLLSVLTSLETSRELLMMSNKA